MEWTLVPMPVQDAAKARRKMVARQQERGAELPPPISSLLDSLQVRQALVKDEQFARWRKPWDVEDLRRFADDDKTTTKRFSEVMDLCARLRDESGGDNVVISTRDVERLTREDPAFEDITVAGWRAACRWVGRYLESQYPDVPRWPDGEPHAGTPQWPLVAISGKQLGVYDELYVGITAEQADRWKSIR